MKRLIPIIALFALVSCQPKDPVEQRIDELLAQMIENGQIVYHTYYIFEGDEGFEASRDDYTLYFNLYTKLIERVDCVSYTSDHQVEMENSFTVSMATKRTFCS